jgi:hypothetical protein
LLRICSGRFFFLGYLKHIKKFVTLFIFKCVIACINNGF